VKQARWARLLEDDDFRRWHENLARGSEGTAVERARVLYRFLDAQGMTPRALVDAARQARALLVVNDLGIEIWNTMKDKIKVADIIEKLMKKYGVKFDDSKRETTKFVEELLRNELLAVSGF
jgi:hypothetical protein